LEKGANYETLQKMYNTLRIMEEEIKKVKLSLCLIKHYATKTYGGVEV
jgi:hypothetical protein